MTPPMRCESTPIYLLRIRGGRHEPGESKPVIVGWLLRMTTRNTPFLVRDIAIDSNLFAPNFAVVLDDMLDAIHGRNPGALRMRSERWNIKSGRWRGQRRSVLA